MSSLQNRFVLKSRTQGRLTQAKPSSTWYLRQPWVVLLLIFALLISACSGPAPAAPAAGEATKAADATAAPAAAATGDKIKVGILHSLSGTMSISEVSVKDATLLAINEINAAGGVMGKQLEPVIEDGSSDWPTTVSRSVPT